MTQIIHNMWEYKEKYDKELLGNAVCTTVNMLKDDFKVKRAGCILYTAIRVPIVNKCKSPRNVWRNEYNTYTQKHNFFYNNFSDSQREFKTIVNNKPDLNDLCLVMTHTIKIYYCMGVDAKYGTLTDFGGTVKRGENVIHAALRELKEETLGLIKYKQEDLCNNVVVYNNEVCIIFVPIFHKCDELLHEFNKLYKLQISQSGKSEMSTLHWMKKENFIESVYKPNFIYEPVRELLCECIHEITKKITE
jgi:hypothetical protein